MKLNKPSGKELINIVKQNNTNSKKDQVKKYTTSKYIPATKNQQPDWY